MQPRLQLLALLGPGLDLGENALGTGPADAELLQAFLAGLDGSVVPLPRTRIVGVLAGQLIQPVQERVLDLLVVGLDSSGDDVAQLG